VELKDLNWEMRKRQVLGVEDHDVWLMIDDGVLETRTRTTTKY
jgi:hypothetical protein